MRTKLAKLLFFMIFAGAVAFTGTSSYAYWRQSGFYVNVNYGQPYYYGYHGYHGYYGYRNCRWIPAHYNNYGYWVSGRRVCWTY